MKGDEIILEKMGEEWEINSKYKVWDKKIVYLLDVMKDIRVKSSVPNNLGNSVINNIATIGVKVEIYEKQKLIKTYYIGGNTPDHKGTYMIMKGAKQAYILDIPNRRPGILNPKFGMETYYVNQHIWREPITINIEGKNIMNISVINFTNPSQSFKCSSEKNKLELLDGGKIINFNKKKLQAFINSFTDLKCGSYKMNLDINNLNFHKEIIIQHKNGFDVLKIYDIKEVIKNKLEQESNVVVLYAKWNESDLFTIQKNIFNKVLITLDEIKQ